MESEYKKGSIGGFIANGYDCGSLKFNPYSSHQFIISITDEGLFIKNSREKNILNLHEVLWIN